MAIRILKTCSISLQEEAQPLNQRHNEASQELAKDCMQSTD